MVDDVTSKRCAYPMTANASSSAGSNGKSCLKLVLNKAVIVSVGEVRAYVTCDSNSSRADNEVCVVILELL